MNPQHLRVGSEPERFYPVFYGEGQDRLIALFRSKAHADQFCDFKYHRAEEMYGALKGIADCWLDPKNALVEQWYQVRGAMAYATGIVRGIDMGGEGEATDAH